MLLMKSIAMLSTNNGNEKSLSRVKNLRCFIALKHHLICSSSYKCNYFGIKMLHHGLSELTLFLCDTFKNKLPYNRVMLRHRGGIKRWKIKTSHLNVTSKGKMYVELWFAIIVDIFP